MRNRRLNEAAQKLTTLLTMASEVDPGIESSGIFWCHGRGLDPEEPHEPPFETMICVPTLLKMIAKHRDLVALINELASSDPSQGASEGEEA